MNVSTIANWCEKKNITKESSLFYSFGLVFFCMSLGTSPHTASAMIVLAIWLFTGMPIRHWRMCLTSKWAWPVLMFMTLPWVGMLHTPDPSGLGIAYAQKTHYWLFAFAIATVSFKTFPASKLIRAFMAGLGLNVVIALVQLAAGLPDSDGRYHGLGPGYTTLSSYLIVGMLMAAWHFRETDVKRDKIISGVLAALYFSHLVILESRTGYVAFILLSPLLVHTFFKKIKVAHIAIACVLLPAVMMVSPAVRTRVALSVEQVKYHMNADSKSAWGREYSPQQDRFYMWYGAVGLFRDNPVFGVGTGGFQNALNNKRPGDPKINHPHNSFLYMAVCFGIFGIAAFVWLFGYTIVNSWRNRHRIAGFFTLSASLTILASGMFNTQLLNFGPAFLLAIAVGLQQEFSDES